MNKFKIFNDPLYGFITIPNGIIFDLIEHKYFQRLRRISQTGLTQYVYPGCTHSRFLHALGCLNLMQKAVQTLRLKNVEISPEEEQAVYIAILLHDIGHGPFSHTLERTIVKDVSHEQISLQLMHYLNTETGGRLNLAIEIFTGKYPRYFLNELIASQLDIDRLDYLKRDSFFSGVAEGNINSDRIISMLNVHENRLVIDEKGIYSVEKFLISRMFMYWQVYMHKTSLAAEIYLTQAFRRAQELAQNGEKLPATPALEYFLSRQKKDDFDFNDINAFVDLDDNDILFALKQWQNQEDEILSILAKSIIQRKLPKAEIYNQKIPKEEIEKQVQLCEKLLGAGSSSYFVHDTEMSVTPYNKESHPILLLNKKKQCMDIAESPKQILTQPLYLKTVKHHFCSWNQEKLLRLKKNKYFVEI
ncbi:HD domain [Candidatus Ornithobacterium hominis]|uniref:HD domain-containing protein n=1 Tax=Candidatus Ornithobacterium hominis TaxID=2497989 RepID=UPI0024BC20DF|nr:HD domain-containing protein [Candidatus Ornithobacterium hominis]CAI9428789.1 HD domain [Candidatus Ornithobacterium hominis]